MAKYFIEIDCDNAAFEDNIEGELSIILRKASAKVSNGEFDFKLRDSNGNTVGTAYLEEDEPDAERVKAEDQCIHQALPPLPRLSLRRSSSASR